MKQQQKILILLAHPTFDKSRLNKALIQAVQGLEGVTIQDLYELYPNFYINVSQEQELLREHDVIVFQHPLYWYSSPGILKEWQDLVLIHGFAYGEKGSALQGKKLLSVITTGQANDAYQKEGMNRYTMKEFLVPFEMLAHFCGMEYLPPFLVHGAGQKETLDNLEQTAQNYRNLLLSLQDSLKGELHAT